ncbi:MAG TPA: DUF4157 domain-containing protein [Thermoanaerobaculia bacterium]|nr:DUF4157 domain-containing protein [Thermoanaerobaculia bacterium]
MAKLQIPRSTVSGASSTFQPAQRPFASKRPIQAKLTLGPVNDKYEQEADSVARQVTRQIAAPSTSQPAAEATGAPAGVAQRVEGLDEDDLQAKAMPGAVQRVGELDEDDLKMKPMPGAVQRVGSGEGGAIDSQIEGSIEGARSGGRALDEGLRGSMEPAFGADFSGVRVHTDAKADSLNRSLQARAFTTGQDIFFRSGEYNPGSGGGKELVAHELTHVVQQNGPTVAKKPEE